jgi:hypothetical protein
MYKGGYLEYLPFKVPAIYSTCYFCQNLINLEFSSQISKYSQISNFKKCLQREPCCSMRTDRHDHFNGRFSQFCGSALKRRRRVTLSCCDFVHFALLKFKQRTRSKIYVNKTNDRPHVYSSAVCMSPKAFLVVLHTSKFMFIYFRNKLF